MPKRIIVIGAGGFGRETADVVNAINGGSLSGPIWHLVGVYDDHPSDENLARLASRDIRYLHSDPGIAEGSAQYFVVGIGDPEIRQRIAVRFEAMGWTPAVLIHPSAVCGTEGRIGPGTVVCSGVQVSTNVTLGRHVHLNANVTVGHDTTLANFTSVNPGAVVSGETLIEDCCLIGAKSVVLQGLTVGHCSTVGAGACVTRNVRPRSTVIGVPAKEVDR